MEIRPESVQFHLHASVTAVQLDQFAAFLVVRDDVTGEHTLIVSLNFKVFREIDLPHFSVEVKFELVVLWQFDFNFTEVRVDFQRFKTWLHLELDAAVSDFDFAFDAEFVNLQFRKFLVQLYRVDILDFVVVVAAGGLDQLGSSDFKTAETRFKEESKSLLDFHVAILQCDMAFLDELRGAVCKRGIDFHFAFDAAQFEI